MPKDKDDKHQPGEEFSLDAILAEFGEGSTPPEEPAPPAEEIPAPKEEPNWKDGDTIPFPIQKKNPAPPPPPPAEEPPAPPVEQSPAPEGKADPDETKVLNFPVPEQPGPVAAGIEKLKKKADEFAGHMYEQEGSEVDPQVRRAEKLIPGVDREETFPVHTRKPRREEKPAPDLSAAVLAKHYAKGLKAARVRSNLAFGALFLVIYLALAESFPIPVPVALAASAAMRCYALAGAQVLVIALCYDTFYGALERMFKMKPGLDLLVVLGNLVVLLDAVTLPTVSGGSIPRQPLCAAAALTLWCTAWGSVQKRRGQRLACRAAAAASEPYLITRDEGKWNSRDTYAKWSGKPIGFGSQIQGSDGAERVFRRLTPVMLCACLLFAIISSLGRHRPEDLLWALGATLTAASPLSLTICFGLPWRRLSRRLSQSGAALAGWEGVVNTTGGSNLLLTDTDLFPPGSVTINNVKVFGDVSVDKVIGVTATVIRDSGSGLEKVFHDLLRSQGTVYRKGEKLIAYEGGGVSEIIRDELVLVGSAPFMVLMDVPLPPGLNVQNAVFCAIDGELQGLFAMSYDLNPAVPYALDSLIHNKITPVLATRDFNLIPAMLRQRFKLPVEKMEFPPVERRRELSARDQEHSDALAAVLVREGVGPYAEAVVGARRLRSAVRLSTLLACVGSVVGALLAFYLTFVAAYASLTTMNLMVFLLAWLVPAPLIAGWVDRY